jgi:hypothetical protein
MDTRLGDLRFAFAGAQPPVLLSTAGRNMLPAFRAARVDPNVALRGE